MASQPEHSYYFEKMLFILSGLDLVFQTQFLPAGDPRRDTPSEAVQDIINLLVTEDDVLNDGNSDQKVRVQLAYLYIIVVSNIVIAVGNEEQARVILNQFLISIKDSIDVENGGEVDAGSNFFITIVEALMFFITIVEVLMESNIDANPLVAITEVDVLLQDASLNHRRIYGEELLTEDRLFYAFRICASIAYVVTKQLGKTSEGAYRLWNDALSSYRSRLLEKAS